MALPPGETSDGMLLRDVLSRQQPLAVINLFVASLSALVFVGDQSPSVVLAWLVAMSALQVARLVWAGRLARAAPLPATAPMVLTVLSAFSGLGWAAMGLLFFGPTPSAHQAYVHLVLAGMGAGAIGALAAHPPALNLFLACSLLPYAARLAVEAHPEAVLMSLATVGYAAGLAYLGSQTHAMQRRLVRALDQNTRLVAQLDVSRQRLEELVQERTGRLQEANAALVQEVEQRRRTEEQVLHLGFHDALTGLPNRLLLVDRLEQAMAQARRHRGRLAVAIFDLDRFKEVNDTHGHLAGDGILAAVAQRVRAGLRASDTVARMGGDEFAVVAPEIADGAAAEHLGRKLVELCAAPVIVGDLELQLTLSVGVALYPDHGAGVDALLGAADLALYEAKNAGRGRALLVSPGLQSTAKARRRIAADLGRALERSELRLLYQTRCRLRDARPVGVEALLRWQHPELGLLGPEEFILIAETSGLIRDIGDWVLATACRDAGRLQWLCGPLRIAVNLSAIELRQPDLVERVRAHLAATGLLASLLELEITETAMLHRGLGALEADLKRLDQVGVRIAIDDFGTGYSSLAYLSWLPVDVIKIDKGFVGAMLQDARARAIVEAIVTLARALGKTVVAEGIETPGQLAALEALGCDEGQGFLLGRPMPLEELRVHLGRPS